MCRISWSLFNDCSFSSSVKSSTVFFSIPLSSGETIGKRSTVTAAEILHGFFSHWLCLSWTGFSKGEAMIKKINFKLISNHRSYISKHMFTC